MVRLRQKISRDERGMLLVFVAAGFMAFLSASMLAIDVGMFMVARSQAQNAADAGALAGAVALVYDDATDKSASGPAVQSALGAATANQVMDYDVSVTPADVTFPPGDRVRVNVFRTGGRGNPVSTLVASYFGITDADVEATATAQASPANAMTCVKPFTIPDKWIEAQTPPWDPSDTFDAYDKKGNPLPNPDIYVPADQPGYTGYNAYTDKGTQLALKAGTGNNIEPSFYFAWAIPGSSGAADYRWNIGNCNTTVVGFGDLITAEPGNMVGPTRQGMQELYDLDPTAYWDTLNNKYVSTMSPSPRVVAIPVFDPVYYDTGKRNGRNADLKAVNYVGFFIEGLSGGDVLGRMTPISGLMKGSGAGPAPPGAFPRAIVCWFE